MSAETTIPGYTNPNQQINLGRDNPNGTDHGQSVYAMKCQRVGPGGGMCGSIYGANGTDIWQRKCPVCQDGRAGLPLTRNYS